MEQNHDIFDGHIILGDDENIVIADQGPIGSPIGTIGLNTSAWLDQEQWHFNGTYTSFSTRMYGQSHNFFRQALTTSALLAFGMTGRVAGNC